MSFDWLVKGERFPKNRRKLPAVRYHYSIMRLQIPVLVVSANC